MVDAGSGQSVLLDAQLTTDLIGPHRQNRQTEADWASIREQREGRAGMRSREGGLMMNISASCPLVLHCYVKTKQRGTRPRQRQRRGAALSMVEAQRRS